VCFAALRLSPTFLVLSSTSCESHSTPIGNVSRLSAFGPRGGHSLTALHDDLLVAYGGTADGSVSVAQLHVYSGNEWVEIHPVRADHQESDDGHVLPPSIGHTCVKVNETLYFWGGTSAKQRLNGLWQLACSNTEWQWDILHEQSTTGTPHPSRLGHAAAAVGSAMVVHGGYVYRSVGTAGAHRVAVADTNIFDSETQSWRSVPPGQSSLTCPIPRAGHTMVKVGKYMVVYGGVNPETKTRCGDVHFLDIENWSWKRLEISGDFPQPRSGHVAVALPQDRMLIFGGLGNSGELKDAHILDISTMTWSPVTFAGLDLCGRYGTALTAATGASRVWIYGGTGQDGSAFLFGLVNRHKPLSEFLEIDIIET